MRRNLAMSRSERVLGKLRDLDVIGEERSLSDVEKARRSKITSDLERMSLLEEECARQI
jgi:hypothetical protein